jgi:hypothetical protein
MLPLPWTKDQESKERAGDKVNVHIMWEPKDPYPRVTSRDKNFQKNLLTACIELADTSRGLPRNAQAHLWTDRKGVRALNMPSVLAGDVEIEIGRSMLSRLPFHLHRRKELCHLIAMVKSDDDRKMLRELLYHPANVNIGFRSDVERALYCFLYSARKKSSTRSGKRELNIHIDVDSLAAIKEKIAYLKAGHQEESFKCGDFDNAKAVIKAMGEEIKNLPLPPESDELTEPELKAPAERPQKSRRAPAAGESRTGEKVKIPKSVLKTGYLTRSNENDLIAMVPKNIKARAVVESIHAGLRSGTYMPPRFYSDLISFEDGKRQHAQIFHMLNSPPGTNPGAPDTDLTVSYYRLAQRIVDSKEDLIRKVLGMPGTSESGPNSLKVSTTNLNVRMRVKAIEEIFRQSTEFISDFVNAHTYVPQLANNSTKEWKKFSKITEPVFGVKPDKAKTHSWAATFPYVEYHFQVDAGSAQYQLCKWQVFKEIKAMLRSQTDDDIELDYLVEERLSWDATGAPKNHASAQSIASQSDTMKKMGGGVVGSPGVHSNDGPGAENAEQKKNKSASTAGDNKTATGKPSGFSENPQKNAEISVVPEGLDKGLWSKFVGAVNKLEGGDHEIAVINEVSGSMHARVEYSSATSSASTAGKAPAAAPDKSPIRKHDIQELGFKVMLTSADGDCMYHAIGYPSQNMKLIRNAVANVIASRPDDEKTRNANAYQTAGALLQTPATQHLADQLIRPSVPNGVYAMLVKIPGIYSGLDELAALSTTPMYRKKRILAIDSDGTLTEISNGTTNKLAYTEQTKKKVLLEALQRADLRLYKTPNHWERIDTSTT